MTITAPPASPRAVALLLNNDFVTDSRARKMAAALAAAGYRVTVIARQPGGLPDRERDETFDVVRIVQPTPLSRLPRIRLAQSDDAGSAPRGVRAKGARVIAGTIGRALQAVRYLLLARAWAREIARVVGPMDAWQAEELVMLPVAMRLRRRLGGLVVHDARDLDLHSTGFARLPGPWRSLLAWRERTWVRAADAVIAASSPYADVLGERWGRAPTVVWNGPSAILAPSERGRGWHDRLRLPPEQRVVLYLGLAIAGRGIETLCRAMADVPTATLVVAGFGPAYERYRVGAAALPHADRIAFTGPVRSDGILEATAAADVAAMPVQGDTLNHRLNTPTKLFDAMGAGTPVVASDLPGLAGIVRAAGCGELCDPEDPIDIARALRLVLDGGRERWSGYQAAGLGAAREVYAWERQAVTYLDLYAGLPWPAGVHP